MGKGAILRGNPLFSMGAVLTSRVLGAGASLLTLLILTNALSAEGVGLFVTVQSAATLSALFAAVNLDGAAIRVLPGLAKHELGTIPAFLSYLRRHLVVSLPLAAIGGGIWVSLSTGNGLLVFGLTAAMVTVAASLRISAAVDRALGDVQGSAFIALAVRPWLLLTMVALLWATALLDPIIAVVAAIVTFGISALLIVQRLNRRLPPKGTPIPRDDQLDRQGWRRTGLVLLTAALFTEEYQNIVLLLVGAFMDEAEVARLAVLLRIVVLMRMIPAAAAMAFGVDIAASVKRGELGEADKLARKGARLSVLVAVPAAIMAALLSDVALWVFGETYRQDAGLLSILVISVVISAIAGPCLPILAAAGENKAILGTTAVSLVALVIAIAVAAPLGLGAVVPALVAVQVVWDGGLLLSTRFRLGLMPWALAPFLAPRRN